VQPIGVAVSVTAAAFAAAVAVFAQDVLVRLSGEHLRVSAPGFHFITGKPLENLKNGLTVPFDIQVSVLAEGKMTILDRSFERFIISYDLWEERFSVTRMRSTRASASHLTAGAAEAWCLEKFNLSTARLPEDKPFWVRVDVRARNSRDTGNNNDEGSLSLSTLIDILSRPAKKPGEYEWRAESMPVRLSELRRAASK
jgi:hypothetical protein